VLRELLIGLPPIGPVAPASTDLLTILREPLPLSPFRARVTFLADELARALAIARPRCPDTIALIERCFVDRIAERRAALAALTLARGVVRELAWPVQNGVAPAAWTASWAAQAAVLTEFAADDRWGARGTFVERFAAMVGRQREWAVRTGFLFEIDVLVWIDVAACTWTFEQFRGEHPRLVEGDRKLGTVPTELPKEKWVAQIAGETRKMVGEFRSAMNAKWPGLIARLFVEAFQRWEMIMTVVWKEVGADEMMPLLMFVRDLAKCEEFLVAVGYVVETTKAVLEWVEHNPGCGVSLGSVDRFAGFSHKLTTLASTAGERAHKLDRLWGIKVDFNFLN
jgi:hypothetical protein